MDDPKTHHLPAIILENQPLGIALLKQFFQFLCCAYATELCTACRITCFCPANLHIPTPGLRKYPFAKLLMLWAAALVNSALDNELRLTRLIGLL
jgi:hypothetical protein